MFNFIEFLKRLLGLGTATIKDVQNALANAEKALEKHVDHLLDAQEAIVEHNVAAQQTIAGLASAIGQEQAKIDTANQHLETVQAALASVK